MPKLTEVLHKLGTTINLAKPNAFQIPKKPPLNSLVFEKLPDQGCGEKITQCYKSPVNTKPVRICTKDELKSFYCPTPCDCKIKPPPLTFSQKIGFLIKQTLKALVVGGLICFTYHEGLWSDAFRSTCILGKFLEVCPEEEEEELNEFMDISSITITDPEPCQPYIPRTGVMLYNVGKLWNSVVQLFFWCILEAPFLLWKSLTTFSFLPKKQEVKTKPCRT